MPIKDIFEALEVVFVPVDGIDMPWLRCVAVESRWAHSG
jgi:hypothetical protein